MVVGGPIFFFQQDPSEYARRSRKSLALVEQLEGDKEESARGDVKELVQEETPPGLENLQLESREQTLYNKDLVSKIEEDAKLFISQEGTSSVPSLHKFLPLLKQAILTFEQINPTLSEKVSLHDRYQNLKPHAGEIFEELAREVEAREGVPLPLDSIPTDIHDTFLSSFYTLVADTKVEYREWQKGGPPQPPNTAPKIHSQVSELTQSFDGSRSGRSRYSRRQKPMCSGADTDGGTSSRSNEGTVYGGLKSARRESARRRNMVSDQSDIIEDLYLESSQQSDTMSRLGRERGGKRKEMESLYELPPHNTTINFSLINQNCTTKGWIISQREGQLSDRSLVRYLLERLQRCRVNRNSEEKRETQQKYPHLIRYYAESEPEPYKTRRHLSWSGRHKLGFVTEVPQELNSRFLAAFPDGSTTLYYPNGTVCCVLSNCPQPKEQDLTRTLNIFHHAHPDMIVASFNPSGVGSVWYENKVPAFLSTLLGGCVYTEQGVPARSWTWNNIDTEDFLLKISDYLTLYFTVNGELFLHLQLAEECVFLNVKTSKSPMEELVLTPTLQSTSLFRSVTAQTLLNAPKTRNRRRMRQKRVSSTRVTDDSETEELLYPHKHSLADPVDRYLINTSKKVVRVSEELLQQLRTQLGWSRTRASRAVSANTPPDKLPMGFRQVVGGCKKKWCVTVGLNCTPYLVFPERRGDTKKRGVKAGNRVKTPRKRISLTCPVSLRMQLSTGDEMTCKCDWRCIPEVGDAEFDRFLSELSSQLLVVTVYSSKHPHATPCQPMLEDIFYGMNYSRCQPCVQATQDRYRIVRYDLARNTLLKTRHNALPGMLFFYCRSKLLFANLIFNGYGNAKKDFLKQAYKCGKLAEEGKFLPPDFKFTGLRGWDEADETVRQILKLQFGQTGGWIAPKLTPLTKKEDICLIGW